MPTRDEYTLQRWTDSLFQARLDDRDTDDEGRFVYGWTRMYPQAGTADLVPCQPPQTGTTTRDSARHPSNEQIEIPSDEGSRPIVWLKFRGIGDGQPVDDIVGGAGGGDATFPALLVSKTH